MQNTIGKILTILLLAPLMVACSILGFEKEAPAKVVPSVRLNMVWSPNGPDEMAVRTRALKQGLEGAGFSVVLNQNHPPEPTYPFLFISVQHGYEYCLGGVFYIYTSKDNKEGFELYQEKPYSPPTYGTNGLPTISSYADPYECANYLVQKLLVHVRPQ